MRFHLAGLALILAAPAGAQSTSRDWRPTDRTIIGDFSRITSIATTIDRVLRHVPRLRAGMATSVPPLGRSFRSSQP